MDVAVGGMLAYMVEVGNRRALSHDGAHEHAALERPQLQLTSYVSWCCCFRCSRQR